MKTGLIVGKFYPPTNGHLYMIQEARKRVDMLTVIVGWKDDEEIPGSQRRDWLRELVGTNTTVFDLPDDTPEGVTSEDIVYWMTWRRNLQRHLPYIPEYIFGSDAYIKDLATWLHITPVLIDQQRVHVPIRATQVREDPMKYIDFVPPIVQEYYRGK